MKKLFGIFLPFMLILVLAACGSDEGDNNAADDTDNENAVEDNGTETNTESSEGTSATLADTMALLQEPTEDTVCEMCNMKVYEKDDDLGKFAAQAVKEDGSIAFYDDIGCLLNAELKFEEENDKFVRDFNTLEWIPVEDATIVKTDLKTPMNWGYAFFKSEEDAQKYIDENDGAYVEELDKVKQLAKERYEKKMQQQGQGNMDGNGNMNMDGNGNMNMNGQN